MHFAKNDLPQIQTKFNELDFDISIFDKDNKHDLCGFRGQNILNVSILYKNISGFFGIPGTQTWLAMFLNPKAPHVITALDEKAPIWEKITSPLENTKVMTFNKNTELNSFIEEIATYLAR